MVISVLHFFPNISDNVLHSNFLPSVLDYKYKKQNIGRPYVEFMLWIFITCSINIAIDLICNDGSISLCQALGQCSWVKKGNENCKKCASSGKVSKRRTLFPTILEPAWNRLWKYQLHVHCTCTRRCCGSLCKNTFVTYKINWNWN